MGAMQLRCHSRKAYPTCSFRITEWSRFNVVTESYWHKRG